MHLDSVNVGGDGAFSNVPSYRKPRRTPATHPMSMLRHEAAASRESWRAARQVKRRSWRQLEGVRRPPREKGGSGYGPGRLHARWGLAVRQSVRQRVLAFMQSRRRLNGKATWWGFKHEEAGKEANQQHAR
eukprot:6211497-Pleurochrysis_carterae.AAC.2